MSRPVRKQILFCFLVAIASNCIQAAQISFNQSPSVVLFGEPALPVQNDDSVFLITDDDDSDQTPNLILTQTEIDDIEPFPFSLSHPGAFVTAVQAKRHTVLRL
jgi:hypothetical protein